MSLIDVGTFNPTAKDKQRKKITGKDEWLDFEEPRIAPVMGMRGSGKGGLMDYMAQRYYDEQFTILHIWSARSLENLYWVINKNCGFHFRKIKQLIKNKCLKDYSQRPTRLIPKEEELYINLAERGKFIKIRDGTIVATQRGADLISGKLVHCKCERAIPILWVLPDYVDMEQESVDRFNGYYWKDMEEYVQHMSEITTQDKELLMQGKLLKPKYLRPVPLIKTKKITPPTSKERKQKFYEEWTEAVLQARDEHRPLIITPLMFEGSDKFDFIGEVFKYHTVLMNKSGHFKPLTESIVGKAEKYWSKKQRNYHKIAIFMNEARSVSPSSKMHGETGAGKSKRTIFDLVPEMRHMKTWYHTDYQNPSDIYDGIRPQSDFVILKKTSLNLAGGDWKWFFDKIENDRFGFMKYLTKGECDDMKYQKNYERRYPHLKKWIDDRRPRIGDLPPNQAYIVYPDNEFILINNAMGKFHHKLSTEDFMLDTGIKWSINREKKPGEKEPTTNKTMKEERKQKKEMRQTLYNKLCYLRDVEKKGWEDIRRDLIQMEKDGILFGFNFEGKSNKNLSNMYGKMKDKFESIPA